MYRTIRPEACDDSCTRCDEGLRVLSDWDEKSRWKNEVEESTDKTESGRPLVRASTWSWSVPSLIRWMRRVRGDT